MSESKEAHRVRMKLKRQHPDWTSDHIRAEMKKILKESSQESSQVHKKGSQGSQESSQPTPNKQRITGSRRSSREVHPRLFIKLDHSVDKYQYILSESLDGISWKYLGTITKGQPFERNGLVIIPTWHKGSGKEGDDQ